jgi:hypothetical protein
MAACFLAAVCHVGDKLDRLTPNRISASSRQAREPVLSWTQCPLSLNDRILRRIYYFQHLFPVVAVFCAKWKVD